MIPASSVICFVHSSDTPALLGGRVSFLAADANQMTDTVIHNGKVSLKGSVILSVQLIDAFVYGIQSFIYGIKSLVYGIKPIIYRLKRLKDLLDQRIRHPLSDGF